jgi:hypothetical protein
MSKLRHLRRVVTRPPRDDALATTVRALASDIEWGLEALRSGATGHTSWFAALPELERLAEVVTAFTAELNAKGCK